MLRSNTELGSWCGAAPDRLSSIGRRDSHDSRLSKNMSRPRLGARPMTPAQRQARRQARLRRQDHRPSAPSARRTPPRPQRWVRAVAALLDLHEEYRAWLDNLPTSLEGSRMAEKLQIIVELRS